MNLSEYESGVIYSRVLEALVEDDQLDERELGRMPTDAVELFGMLDGEDAKLYYAATKKGYAALSDHDQKRLRGALEKAAKGMELDTADQRKLVDYACKALERRMAGNRYAGEKGQLAASLDTAMDDEPLDEVRNAGDTVTRGKDHGSFSTFRVRSQSGDEDEGTAFKAKTSDGKVVPILMRGETGKGGSAEAVVPGGKRVRMTIDAASKLRDVIGDYTLAEVPALVRAITHKQPLPKPNAVTEVAPPGFEGTVLAMKKKHPNIKNPWALAWSMKNKGAESHYKVKGGKPVKKKEEATGDCDCGCADCKLRGRTAIGGAIDDAAFFRAEEESSAVDEANKETFIEARARLLDRLAKDGWKVTGQKAQKDKVVLWFKSQTVHMGHGDEFADATSMRIDIRGIDTDKFMNTVNRWVGHNDRLRRERSEMRESHDHEDFIDDAAGMAGDVGAERETGMPATGSPISAPNKMAPPTGGGLSAALMAACIDKGMAATGPGVAEIGVLDADRGDFDAGNFDDADVSTIDDYQASMGEEVRAGQLFVIINKKNGQAINGTIYQGTVKADGALAKLGGETKTGYQVIDAIWHNPTRAKLKAMGWIGEGRDAGVSMDAHASPGAAGYDPPYALPMNKLSGEEAVNFDKAVAAIIDDVARDNSTMPMKVVPPQGVGKATAPTKYTAESIHEIDADTRIRMAETYDRMVGGKDLSKEELVDAEKYKQLVIDNMTPQGTSTEVAKTRKQKLPESLDEAFEGAVASVLTENYTGHHYFDGKHWYADTAFVNHSQHVMHDMELKHMGFGEFQLVSDDGGEIEFDRMGGKDFPGQSGRSHKLYDNKDGALVKKLIAAMEKANKSELVKKDAKEEVELSEAHMGHHYFDGKNWYGDSTFVNDSQRVLPGMELKHMGFGEFQLVGKAGTIDFDRMRGKDFPGQNGRSHKLYDDKDGELIKELIAAMEKHHKSELVKGDAKKEEVELTEATNGKVSTFLTILSSHLTQHDMAQIARETKRGGRGNIYRLGHLLAALEKVEDDVAKIKDSDSPEALAQLKAAIGKRFNQGFPPADKLIKQIDAFLSNGKMPKITVTKAAKAKANEEAELAEGRGVPRPGTRVKFVPTPASLALYSKPPEKGEEGEVTTVPLGSKRAHFLPGPGGGLVYVKWDKTGTMGVSPNDVQNAGKSSKLSGKKLNAEIERLFKKHGNGVQFNIMDLGKLHREVEAAYNAGEDMGAAMKAAVQKYALNGDRPSESLSNAIRMSSAVI